MNQPMPRFESLESYLNVIHKLNVYHQFDQLNSSEKLERLACIALCAKYLELMVKELQNYDGFADEELEKAVEAESLRVANLPESPQTVKDILDSEIYKNPLCSTRIYNCLIRCGHFGDWYVEDFIHLVETYPDRLLEVRTIGKRAYEDICALVAGWKEVNNE